MRSEILAVLVPVLLVGCGSPCGDELITGNESCAPGCEGTPIGYLSCGGGSGRWCHDTFPTREIVMCVVEESTGIAFLVADPEPRPAGFRYCTPEEREPPECSAP